MRTLAGNPGYRALPGSTRHGAVLGPWPPSAAVQAGHSSSSRWPARVVTRQPQSLAIADDDVC